MTWHVFPEDHGTNENVSVGGGDYNDAASFALALRHTSLGVDYVAEGWDVTIDTDDYTADISPGTAVISDEQAFAWQEQRDMRQVAYVAQTDEVETVDLTNNTENKIYAHLPQNDDDDGEFVVVLPSGSEPDRPRLHIETIQLP